MKLFRVQDVIQALDELAQDKMLSQKDYDTIYHRLASINQLDEYDSIKANASWITNDGDSVFCNTCGYCAGSIQKASTYCPSCGRIMFFDQLF